MSALRASTGPTDTPSPDDALRTLFAQRTNDMPVAPDIATIAVGRARRIARRRLSIGGLAAVLAFALTLGTAVSMRGWWITDENSGRGGGRAGVGGPGPIEFDGLATEQPIDYTPVALRVDVTIDNRIWDSATGKWLSAGGSDPLTDVVRVPLGWLAGDRSGVRLVQYDGTVRPVAAGTISWAVNDDGSQIAMVHDTTLSISQVTGHGAVELKSTTVPAGETPIGFVASTVVLTSSTGEVDAWRPGVSLDPSSVRYVYTSKRTATFGVVDSPGSGRPCLAEVEIGEVGIRQVAIAGCHDLLAQGVGKAAVSPDGQHLATPFDGGLWIVNLDRSVAASAANPSAAPVWVATCASDAGATPVWQDARTVVTSAHGEMVACSIDGIQRPVEMPRGVPASARPVQTRRS
jgi:hypothetical protein